ncbi:MAG: hypothetical protein IJG00_03670 [Clostridia bacterium]|nr:hypothetical protein [Clostridia bacterium]
MSENIKALSNEELELISGGGDAVKIVNKLLLVATLIASAIFIGKFANDVYKESNHGDNLYDKVIRETANLFKKQ